MEYQVWTHDEYEGWWKVDCGDISAAQREVLKALTQGKEPLLTVAVPYDFNVKIKEDKLGEVTKSKAKPDKSTRGPGDSEVRPGDERAPDAISETSRDIESSTSAKD